MAAHLRPACAMRQPMGRMIAVGLLMLASTSLGDYPPPSPNCTVPSACVTCTSRRSTDAGVFAACVADALDAGLQLSDCYDFTGSAASTWGTTSVSNYYCPAGISAYRGCGCTTGEGTAAATGLAFLALLRRRRHR